MLVKPLKNLLCPSSQPSTSQPQHSTVDMTQLQDPHSFTQHSIQVQHIQVSEAVGTVQASAQVHMLQH